MALLLSFISMLLTIPFAVMGDWWYGAPFGFTAGMFLGQVMNEIL